MWQSVMRAKEVLSRGLIWRVGNGCGIKVLGDWWLPFPITYMVQALNSLLAVDARVEELIDRDIK
jgi:hypothetical protein